MKCPRCGGLVETDKSMDSFKPYQCLICKRTYEEGEVKSYEECAGDTCDKPKALDSVYCQKHRDMKKASNDKQKKKRSNAVMEKIKLNLHLETEQDARIRKYRDAKSEPDLVPNIGGISDINRSIDVLADKIDALIKAKKIITDMEG